MHSLIPSIPTNGGYSINKMHPHQTVVFQSKGLYLRFCVRQKRSFSQARPVNNQKDLQMVRPGWYDGTMGATRVFHPSFIQDIMLFFAIRFSVWKSLLKAGMIWQVNSGNQVQIWHPLKPARMRHFESICLFKFLPTLGLCIILQPCFARRASL